MALRTTEPVQAVAPPRVSEAAEDGVSLIMPAYNEEGNICRAVESALPVLRAIHVRHELVVVESGSTDRTAAILDELSAVHPALRVIHQGAKLGLGSALIEGFEAARYERLLYLDGDNPYDVAEFQQALPLLELCEIVNGYRLSRSDPWLRRLYTILFRLAMRWLFGVRLRDANIGFKLMRRSVVRSLGLTSRGFLIDAELLIKAHRLGCRIREFGVAYHHRTAGESTITFAAARRIGIELLQLRWRLWRSRPVAPATAEAESSTASRA
jgi:glycosyltransferase involved in cell wall biosynthesis